MKCITAIAVVLVVLCATLDAYVFTGSHWPDGSIVMQLQLGSSGPLLDGTSSWGDSAEAALATWNSVVSRAQFRVVRDSAAPTGRANGYNNVLFSSSIYGQAFDASTLAITLTRYFVSSGQSSESDVIFNTAFSWNSYSGALRRASSGGTLIDFRRVALHEFGHVLGLDHPDQYGQSVAAVMNSHVSNTDQLQSDDIAGVAALYGGTGAGTPPPSPSLSAPGAPSGLTTAATGSSVSLAWRAPASGGAPSTYVIEAGSASGLANLANFSTGSASTSFSAGGVGAGSYYIRVKATNAAGTSGASNESLLIVGGGACSSAPGA
ncbi:MAG TPA: matrixin family metalloprotease, partial [Vicinamibacterales bacterium]|nr:matrixin family metalloprotease [Vicinamibacterales bacterium]